MAIRGIEVKELQTTGFVKPYPQEMLGGELGLNSDDICKVLGVRHQVVTNKIKRIDKTLWENAGWHLRPHGQKVGLNITPCGVKSGNKGRPRHTWSMNTLAAKAFVAKWDNPIGVGYLNFLFQCEKAAPKLVEEVRLLRMKLKKLEKPMISKSKDGVVAYLVKAKVAKDMFGTEYVEKIREHIPIDQLTEEEYRNYRIEHRAAVMEGLSKKQRHEIENKAVEALPPSNRGGVIRLLDVSRMKK